MPRKSKKATSNAERIYIQSFRSMVKQNPKDNDPLAALQKFLNNFGVLDHLLQSEISHAFKNINTKGFGIIISQ